MFKFLFPISLFIAFWWVDNSFFSGWAEVTRYVSFIWLLVQGLLLIDFAHDIHDLIIKAAGAAEAEGEDARQLYLLYLFMALASIACVCVGLAYLFQDYSSCDLGLSFTVITLLGGVITTVLSVLNCVNKGLLTPAIVFAYNTFLCWYALQSSDKSSCHPHASGGQLASTLVISGVTLLVQLYCVGNGSRSMAVLDYEGEGVLTQGSIVERMMDPAVSSQPLPLSASQPAEAPSDTEPPLERQFFHLLLALGGVYWTMVLTQWGAADGGAAEASRGGAASLWVKVVAQWLGQLLYLRILQLAYEQRADL